MCDTESWTYSSYSVVIRPRYKYDDRLKIDVEYSPPPDCLYVEVGHDSAPGSGEKHYRKFYPGDLEDFNDEQGH